MDPINPINPIDQPKEVSDRYRRSVRFFRMGGFLLVGILLGVGLFGQTVQSRNGETQPVKEENDVKDSSDVTCDFTPQNRDFSESHLRKRLTDEQFAVTQKDATERPFHNAYWDNKRPGIYVDIVSGEPLFSSLDKFDSGTGWPSFSRPLETNEITEHSDSKLRMTRTEVRSKTANSHLGHVFNDGPAPTGKRYCINSAALRFIPAEDLAKEGYPQFASLFEKKNPPKTETAVLAGGCFWGMEEILRSLPGVLDTRVGYTGGSLKNPTYKDMTRGNTGHAESIEITFDPSRTSYAAILETFFRMHDPTTLNRQGNDRGSQYRSAIFYQSEEQRKTAEEIKTKVSRSGKWKDPIVTEIVAAGPFYEAEDFHQDYLQKHPGGYTCHFLRD